MVKGNIGLVLDIATMEQSNSIHYLGREMSGIWIVAATINLYEFTFYKEFEMFRISKSSKSTWFMLFSMIVLLTRKLNNLIFSDV